ncbi:MAG: TIGR01777 family oxidoreductase [Bacteroidota bacterium]
MKIAITGATGFIGTNLINFLQQQGHEILRLNRADFLGNEHLLKQKLSCSEVVVNLAGAPIVKRWTAKYRQTIYDSRIFTTQKLVDALNPDVTKVLISMSAVGIYAEGKQTEYNFTYNEDFLAQICTDWELEAQRKAGDIRTVVFRLGVVLGQGGALNKQLWLFKLGLGGKIGNGKQGYSWVHVDDVVRAIDFAIETDVCGGVYNLVAPKPVSNRVFTKTLASLLHRPSFLMIPKFALHLLFGGGASVLVNGQFVYPERLLDQDFVFKHNYLVEALECVLRKAEVRV